MQVILLERIGRLGQMGDVVTVKDGFARNYLLPQGKALRATEANRKRFERERAQLEARDLDLKSEAQAVSAKIDRQSFIIIRQAGESGQLYGSVSTRDIAVAVTEGGFSVERRQVMLDRPIKSLGLHDIRVDVRRHLVRLVHEAEPDAGVVLEGGGDLGPEVGEGGVGDVGAADGFVVEAGVVVRVKQDGQVAFGGFGDDGFNALEFGGDEGLVEGGLEAGPAEGEANDVDAFGGEVV